MLAFWLKRTIAILAALVILCVSAAGIADGEKEYISDIAVKRSEKMLRTMTEIYETSRNDFDDDFIYLYYLYYKEHSIAQETVNWEAVFDLKANEFSDGKVFFNDTMKMTVKTTATVNKLADEQYAKWLAGEITSDEFADAIHTMVVAMFKTQEELNK